MSYCFDLESLLDMQASGPVKRSRHICFSRFEAFDLWLLCCCTKIHYQPILNLWLQIRFEDICLCTHLSPSYYIYVSGEITIGIFWAMVKNPFCEQIKKCTVIVRRYTDPQFYKIVVIHSKMSITFLPFVCRISWKTWTSSHSA